MSPLFYIYTNLRCLERSQELFVLRNHLILNGYVETDSVRCADVIIVASCAYLSGTEKRSLRTIKEISRIKKHSAILIVEGCLPIINPKKLEQIHKGPVLHPKNIEKINDILGLKIPLQNSFSTGKLCSRISFSRVLSSIKINGFRALLRSIMEFPFDVKYSWYSIQIGTGCMGHCSYCAIKPVHGELKSKPVDSILQELREGLSRGQKRFLLYSRDVGAYGLDMGLNLSTLLRRIFEIPGNYEVKLYNSINPALLLKQRDEFLEVLKANRGRIKSLFLSIESGSPKILKLMGRGNLKISQLTGYLNRFSKELPEVELLGQFMVGFPGETEKEFQESLDLITNVKFSSISFYRAEIRPNTPAERMPGKVPQKIVERRILKLKKLLLARKIKAQYQNPTG